jgi:hypothetical protein
MLTKSGARDGRALWIGLAVILVGTVSGLLLATALPNVSEEVVLSQDSGEILIPPPKTLAEQVAGVDIILVGTVGPVVNQGWFKGYDDNGNIFVPEDFDPNNIRPENDAHVGVAPYLDFEIDIEEVLKGGELTAPGETVILRVLKEEPRDGPPSETNEYPAPAPGDEHLFFLVRLPDGTYGLRYGSWGRMILTGQVATWSNGRRTPATYEGQTFSPAQLTQRVREIVQQQKQQGRQTP